MKIAVIGSGFFGLSIANFFEERKASVDIFESKDIPFSGASFYNQCRIHQGFHYPRSAYTIYQSIMGFEKFIREYSPAVGKVKKNWYLVKKDSLVNREQYLAVMDSFSLKYQELKDPPAFIKNKQDFELSILTTEHFVNLKKLKSIILQRINSRIHLNHRIISVDAENGNVYTNEKRYGSYDFIINCTYNNPNLGLCNLTSFNLKYELAAILYAKTSLSSNEAVTIMDGPFISVYPADNRHHTISSVIHTPFMKFGNHKDFGEMFDNRFHLAKKNKTNLKIIEHAKEFIDINIQDELLWITGKTKLKTDKGDSREVLVRKNQKLISVLGGKLDAIYEAKRKVLEVLNEDY